MRLSVMNQECEKSHASIGNEPGVREREREREREGDFVDLGI